MAVVTSVLIHILKRYNIDDISKVDPMISIYEYMYY